MQEENLKYSVFSFIEVTTFKHHAIQNPKAESGILVYRCTQEYAILSDDFTKEKANELVQNSPPVYFSGALIVFKKADLCHTYKPGSYYTHNKENQLVLLQK